MNPGGIIRLVVAGVLGAAVAGSFAITANLTRLEEGVNQNIEAARALVEAQKAIRDRNAVLGEMVAATTRIGGGLDGVLARSQAIEANVAAVAEANQATLKLNAAVQAGNAASAQELARVAAGIRSMNRSAGAIRDYLAALGETVAGDVDQLSAIGANTSRMNLRTPGW